MSYNSQDIKSYCGHCDKQFEADKFKCPDCGSHLVNYNSADRSEELAVIKRWKSHNPTMSSKR